MARLCALALLLLMPPACAEEATTTPAGEGQPAASADSGEAAGAPSPDPGKPEAAETPDAQEGVEAEGPEGADAPQEPGGAEPGEEPAPPGDEPGASESRKDSTGSSTTSLRPAPAGGGTPRNRALLQLRRDLGRLQVRLTRHELSLDDLKRERRELERDLDRLPVQVLAGRLGPEELRQRQRSLNQAVDRFAESAAQSRRELADIRNTRAAVPEGNAGQSTQARQARARRDHVRRELERVLVETDTESGLATSRAGELSTLLWQALLRVPTTDLLLRSPFPLSRNTGAGLRQLASLWKDEGTEDEQGRGIALQGGQAKDELPGGLAAVALGLALLVLGTRHARRGREITDEQLTVAARRERVADVIGLHLAFFGVSFVGVELLTAPTVSPGWRGVFGNLWLVWALWHAFRSLSPWLVVVKPPPGAAPGPPERRESLARPIGRSLLWVALTQPLLYFLRQVEGAPLEVVALGETIVGLGLLALLTPCALHGWRQIRSAGKPVRGSGWCVLAVLSAYVLVGLHFCGYHNLARYLATTAPLTAAVILSAWSVYFACTYWLRDLLKRQDDNTLEPWDRWLDGVLQKGTGMAPGLAAILVMLLLFPVSGIRLWHVHRAVDLLSRPLFAVQGSRFSILSAGKAILVIYIAYWVAKVVRRKLQESGFMKARYDSSVRYAASTVAYYLLLIIGVVIGFVAAGLNLSVFTVFSATVGLAVGFGSQDIAKNFISGLILILDRSVGVGDYVEVAGQQGTVTQINIRCTTIRTPDNRTVVVPNATFVAQNVIGSPHRDRRMRIVSEFIVAAAADLKAVEATLLEVARNTEGVAAEPPAEVWISKLAAANTTFQLAVWLHRAEDHVRVHGKLSSAAWQALREAEIAPA